MGKKQVYGIISGPVACFNENDELDEKAIRECVNFLIDGGVHVLLAGTIVAEWPSLSFEERKKLIKIIVDETNNRVPVFSGAGGSDYRQALALIQYGEDTGADGIFLIPPYLYSLSMEEIYDYTKALATATSLPVMIYNIAGTNINPTMYRKLAVEVSNVDSVKESNQTQLPEVVRQVGNKIAVLTSKDTYTLESLLFGAVGVASVLSALAPRMMVDLYETIEQKDFQEAANKQLKIMPISDFLISEGIAAPLKAGLEMMGMPTGKVRKPHIPLNKEKRKILETMLKDLGLLKE